MKKIKLNFIMCLFGLFGHFFSFAQIEKKYALILDTLSSEYMYGRGYVRDGHTKAANYLEEQFKEIGLSSFHNTYVQTFPLTINTFPQPISLIGKEELKLGEDYLIAANSASAKQTRKVFFLNKSFPIEKIHYRKYLKRVPIVSRGFYQEHKRSKFIDSILSPFPIQMIEYQKFYHSLSQTQSRQTRVLIKEGQIKETKKVSIKVDSKLKETVSQNVIGFVPGTENPDSFLVITAHYDHLGGMGQVFFPGANDNASGTALLTCLAEHFSKHPHKVSLVFIAFGGEEAGLVGSKYFVKHPLFSLNKIKFLLNLDLWGSGSEGVTVVNGTEHTKAFDRLVNLNQSNNYVKLIKKRGESANSDHYPFHELGVPSFFLYAMGKDGGYHSIYDTPEKTELDSFLNNFNLLKDYILSF